jgi:hypothetical protein
MPRALHILGTERLTVVPFDILSQLEGELGLAGVPGPTGGEVGDDRVETIYWLGLIEQLLARLLNTVMNGSVTERVVSSCSDALGGLSRWYTRSVPPCF